MEGVVELLLGEAAAAGPLGVRLGHLGERGAGALLEGGHPLAELALGRLGGGVSGVSGGGGVGGG